MEKQSSFLSCSWVTLVLLWFLFKFPNKKEVYSRKHAYVLLTLNSQISEAIIFFLFIVAHWFGHIRFETTRDNVAWGCVKTRLNWSNIIILTSGKSAVNSPLSFVIYVIRCSRSYNINYKLNTLNGPINYILCYGALAEMTRSPIRHDKIDTWWRYPTFFQMFRLICDRLVDT